MLKISEIELIEKKSKRQTSTKENVRDNKSIAKERRRKKDQEWREKEKQLQKAIEKSLLTVNEKMWIKTVKPRKIRIQGFTITYTIKNEND